MKPKQFTGRVIRVGLGIIAITVAAPSANADSFNCLADPSLYLGMDRSGTVGVGLVVNPNIYVCNMSIEKDGVSPEICRQWYATFLSWKALGRKIRMYFYTDGPTVVGHTSCSTFNSWSFKVPYFIEPE